MSTRSMTPSAAVAHAARHVDVLKEFVRESNAIEGIHGAPTEGELEAHERFIALPALSVSDLERFVLAVAKRPLRAKPGMDVFVGAHRPPPGGPHIRDQLQVLLDNLNYSLSSFSEQDGHPSPYAVHREYETLHPFMDGNGRSGRALWLWHQIELGRDPYSLGFLHRWYYESLDGGRS